MSRRYAVEGVTTLKWTVWPLFTLMSVANPWMLGSPAPLTSHSLAGLPGLEFSHAIGFVMGGPQAPCARASDAKTSAKTAAMRAPYHTLVRKLFPVMPHLPVLQTMSSTGV